MKPQYLMGEKAPIFERTYFSPDGCDTRVYRIRDDQDLLMVQETIREGRENEAFERIPDLQGISFAYNQSTGLVSADGSPRPREGHGEMFRLLMEGSDHRLQRTSHDLALLARDAFGNYAYTVLLDVVETRYGVGVTMDDTLIEAKISFDFRDWIPWVIHRVETVDSQEIKD